MSEANTFSLDSMRNRMLSGFVAFGLGSLSLLGCGGDKKRTAEWGLYINCPPHTVAVKKKIAQPKGNRPATVIFTCEDATGEFHLPESVGMSFVSTAKGTSTSAQRVANYAIDFTYKGDLNRLASQSTTSPLFGPGDKDPYEYITLPGIQQVNIRPVEFLIDNSVQ